VTSGRAGKQVIVSVSEASCVTGEGSEGVLEGEGGEGRHSVSQRPRVVSQTFRPVTFFRHLFHPAIQLNTSLRQLPISCVTDMLVFELLSSRFRGILPTPHSGNLSLTPWSRVLLEKLTVPQLVKTFPAI